MKTKIMIQLFIPFLFFNLHSFSQIKSKELFFKITKEPTPYFCVLVEISNYKKNDNLTLHFLNENNNVLIKESLNTQNPTINLRYNIDGQEDGVYYFVVKSNKITYKREIIIETVFKKTRNLKIQNL